MLPNELLGALLATFGFETFIEYNISIFGQI